MAHAEPVTYEHAFAVHAGAYRWVVSSQPLFGGLVHSLVLVAEHCAQTPVVVLHAGVESLQLASLEHAVQTPALQKFDAQSESPAHAVQRPPVQRLDAHWLSLVHVGHRPPASGRAGITQLPSAQSVLWLQ